MDTAGNPGGGWLKLLPKFLGFNAFWTKYEGTSSDYLFAF
jgi:hypothetical protein